MTHIVGQESYIDAGSLRIYQITEKGNVGLLQMNDGLPSNENYLNTCDAMIYTPEKSPKKDIQPRVSII